MLVKWIHTGTPRSLTVLDVQFNHQGSNRLQKQLSISSETSYSQIQENILLKLPMHTPHVTKDEPPVTAHLRTLNLFMKLFSAVLFTQQKLTFDTNIE